MITPFYVDVIIPSRNTNADSSHPGYLYDMIANYFQTTRHTHTCQVTLDISGSPTDSQWSSPKYSG